MHASNGESKIYLYLKKLKKKTNLVLFGADLEWVLLIVGSILFVYPATNRILIGNCAA